MIDIKKPSTRSIFIALLLAGSFSATLLSYLGHHFTVLPAASAQTESESLADPSRFPLAAEPFIPEGLEQSDNPSAGNARAIIGAEDNRVPMTNRYYPWSAIGRVERLAADGSIEGFCTGSLVGPDTVLTNAHCVIDPDTQEGYYNLRFMPNLIDGSIQAETDAAMVVEYLVGTTFSEGNHFPNANDWALLRLDKPLGEIYGVLWVNPFPVSVLAEELYSQLIMVGYSGDFPAENPGNTAGVHFYCSILGELRGSLLHDCDTTGGSSGGPVLAKINENYSIVALNSAQLRDFEHSNGTPMVSDVGIVNYGVQIQRILESLEQSQQ